MLRSHAKCEGAIGEVQSTAKGHRHRVKIKIDKVSCYGPWRRAKAAAEADLTQLRRQRGSAEKYTVLRDIQREAGGW